MMTGGDNPTKALHPATQKLVEDFSQALSEKLAAAQAKYGYADGWRTQDWEHVCRRELLRHIEKGDPLDVAAYCAFMWNRGWSTNPPRRLRHPTQPQVMK